MKRTTQKKSKRKLNSGICILVIAIAAAVIGAGEMLVSATLDYGNSETVRSVHVSDSEIEEATMVIGSHLIHINGLTAELYKKASESANYFNQNQMYYKSELAGGAWFVITDATSIADIATTGLAVDKSVIEALEFTHKTGADGITIDLITGQPVSIFDLDSPYNLSAMEELEPLRIQYQMLREKDDKTDSDNIYLDMIMKFLDENIQTDETKAIDETLKKIEEYKNGLVEREKPSKWSEKTEEIMVGVDAERRVIALKKLADLLDVLSYHSTGMTHPDEKKTEQNAETGDGLAGLLSGETGGDEEASGDDGSASTDEENAEGNEENAEGDEEAEEEIPDFVINSDVVAAVGDCVKNVEESLNEYTAKCLSDSSNTTSGKAEFRYISEFLKEVRKPDIEACDKLMEMLCDLQNILDGVIANQSRELQTLTTDLVQKALSKYKEDLSAGVSVEYQTAKDAGSSQSVLSIKLADQKTAANADRLEYQTMLDAQFMRMNNAEAQSYVLQLIDGVADLRALIQDDEAKPYLMETVEEHLVWLRKEYAKLVKDSNDSSEMSRLEGEKNELSKKRQDALDRGDLDEAARLEAEMEAKQRDINSLAEKLNALLNSPDSSEADKAKARAALGDSNTSAVLAGLADDLSSLIRSGDGDGFENQMEALAAVAQLDPVAGATALQQIKDALAGATELDADTLSALNSALDDAAGGLENATDAFGSGIGGYSENALDSLTDSVLNSLFGTDFDKSSSMQQASAILALEWIGEEIGATNSLDLAAKLAKRAAREGNIYLYGKYSKEAKEHMSLQTLGNVLGYRYVFSDVHDRVTLKKASKFYSFTVGNMNYETAGGTVKTLKATPKQMDTVYIAADDCKQIFGIKTEYLQKAAYGIAVTAELESTAKQIYESIMGGGA